MTSEGLGEMFEGDSADTCGGKFSLRSMGDQAEGLACAEPGSRTPIGAHRNILDPLTLMEYLNLCISSHSSPGSP